MVNVPRATGSLLLVSAGTLVLTGGAVMPAIAAGLVASAAGELICKKKEHNNVEKKIRTDTSIDRQKTTDAARSTSDIPLSDLPPDLHNVGVEEGDAHPSAPKIASSGIEIAVGSKAR